MRTFKIISLALIILSTITGCTKETEITNPASQPTSNGEYIEFTISGQQYSFTSSGSGNTLLADASAHLVDMGFQKGLIFRFIRMSPLGVVGFSAHDINYPMANQYTISGDPNQMKPYNPSEFGFIMEDQSQYNFTTATTGSFEFTSIDSVAGGIVEGTIQLTNLDFTDENGDVISTGHTLSNGKFKVIIQ